MSTPQPAHGLMHFYNGIRFSFAKLLYDGFFTVMIRDRSWQEPVIDSLAPQANDRIVDFGAGSGSTAIALASRFPKASFVGIDLDRTSVEKATRDIARRHLANVRVLAAPLHDRLPFDASSFDKAVCLLAFHDRLPDEKLRLSCELRRVLRRGGTLHVADYDKPTNSNEQRILAFAERISVAAAAKSHRDGSWTDFLAKAGFVAIRRQSSHSVGIGRISVVRARKP